MIANEVYAPRAVIYDLNISEAKKTNSKHFVLLEITIFIGFSRSIQRKKNNKLHFRS